MIFPKSAAWIAAAFLISPSGLRAASYAEEAAEVSARIERDFWMPKRNLYSMEAGGGEPDHLWGAGVMFSAVVAAARHDPHYKSVLPKFFKGLDAFWDAEANVPGYEPSPTSGNGNDKYYDDNAWMVITYLEAYQLTGGSRYLKRAGETLDFVMSGWDKDAGGGIWWHELHKDDAKNVCVNAPAAVGCLRISTYLPPKAAETRVEEGRKLVGWTNETLQAESGLFNDHIRVATGKIATFQLTYNSALMLRANLCLHALTGENIWLDEAVRIGNAADAMLDPATGAWRDAIKWSHLMVEADLELHRRTGDAKFLERARASCDFHYAAWKKNPPRDLLANASLARELWLMADRESAAGREFWGKADSLRK